jgi:PEP-CTERM motif
VNSTTTCLVRRLCVIVAVSSLMVLASGSHLVAAPILSDELLVTAPGGAPVFQDTLIQETAGAGTESSALATLGPPGPGLVTLQPPGALAVLFPPGPIPGATYVVLAEPAPEPIDPTELPPVFYAGANGPVRVSDVLVNGTANQAGLPPFIALVSDNNPDLAFAVAKIPPGAPIVLETGGLQDLTPLIGPAVFPGIGPVAVQVRSDVSVPEPSSLVILLGFVGTGLVGFIRHRRRPA